MEPFIVKDIHPGYSSYGPSNLTNVNGTLYFTASDSYDGFYTGKELWKSDGTEAGTTLVKEIEKGLVVLTPIT